jgi:hypothetical protein
VANWVGSADKSSSARRLTRHKVDCTPCKLHCVEGGVVMSETWIYLIPDDPRFIPDSSKQELARRRFSEVAPEAKEIELSVGESVKFQDCGANFERICCPSCHTEIPISWWQKCMNEDFDGQGFKVEVYITLAVEQGPPCTISPTNGRKACIASLSV